MKILFVASEVEPFAKTGGLADVAAALPKALTSLGHEVRIVMPRYRQVDAERFGLRKTPAHVTVGIGSRALDVQVWQAPLPKSRVMTYFLDQPALFNRGGLYQEQGQDYPDNLERFSGFAQAALRLVPALDWRPDLIHCHDWQTALVPAHLRWGSLGAEPFFASIGTVFTVHNLAYQGVFPREQWPLTVLPAQAFTIEGLEFYGKMNCLKGGLVSAGLLTTVSPTYAQEIQSPDVGCGLEGVLAARRDELVGILNGIDPDEWNPQTDPHIGARYTAQDLAGKAVCKRGLQELARLPVHADRFLIGMIQRLAEQKGIDIFLQALERLLALPLQIVILGTGDPRYHEQLEASAARFPGQLAVRLTFDNALAHQIEAGADAFLMPSRFEPCGLNQMYSMRYGTVPIVRRVGGLADTVADATTTTGAAEPTGFVFVEYTAEALIEAVRRALAAFNERSRWARLVQNGMRQDVSWSRSAREYVRVYERAMAKA